MSTKEWARELRKRQVSERNESNDSLRAVDNAKDGVWDELRQELNAGIEGYGTPHFGRFEKSPMNHVWWVRVMSDTPNRNTRLREIKAIYNSSEREIRFSYVAVDEAKELVIALGILPQGGVGLLWEGREIGISDVAQKALEPFLS